MRTVCRDWSNGVVHVGVLVIRDDGKGGPDNDTICYDCLWIYRAKNGLDWLNKEMPAAYNVRPDHDRVEAKKNDRR